MQWKVNYTFATDVSLNVLQYVIYLNYSLLLFGIIHRAFTLLLYVKTSQNMSDKTRVHISWNLTRDKADLWKLYVVRYHVPKFPI